MRIDQYAIPSKRAEIRRLLIISLWVAFPYITFTIHFRQRTTRVVGDPLTYLRRPHMTDGLCVTRTPEGPLDRL